VLSSQGATNVAWWTGPSGTCSHCSVSSSAANTFNVRKGQVLLSSLLDLSLYELFKNIRDHHGDTCGSSGLSQDQVVKIQANLAKPYIKILEALKIVSLGLFLKLHFCQKKMLLPSQILSKVYWQFWLVVVEAG
jgi:hypothetical protein